MPRKHENRVLFFIVAYTISLFALCVVIFQRHTIQRQQYQIEQYRLQEKDYFIEQSNCVL